MSEELSDHTKMYLKVFGVLCVFTALSVAADSIPGKATVTVVVLTIACFKASFVVLFFMHLKFEGKWKWLLLTPTVVLAAALPVALSSDISTHYYKTDVPQNQMKVYDDFESGEHDNEPSAQPKHDEH